MKEMKDLIQALQILSELEKVSMQIELYEKYIKIFEKEK